MSIIILPLSSNVLYSVLKAVVADEITKPNYLDPRTGLSG